MSSFAVKWIFELDRNYEINVRQHLPPDFPTGCAFKDRCGTRRLEIHSDGRLVVLAGYAWDGCTPKFSLFDIVFGVPDGIPNERTRKPKAYYASMVHDVLYQLLDAGLPLTRAHSDRIFLELLQRDKFAPSRIYYWAVRIFGGGYRHITGWKRKHGGGSTDLS